VSEPAADDVGLEEVVSAIASVLRTGRRPVLPEEIVATERLDDLLDQLVDITRFAMALSKGDLEQELRHSGVAAGSLKGLQGALRHVSWQAQRVAGGDLSQRMDFMGAFAAAFNSMVEALAEARAALEAKNAKLQRQSAQLEELATTDALTGLWNRRKFNELVAGEVARAYRYSQPVSLGLLDVDHFKRVNDTYGHDVGDAVLRELADVVRGQVRSVDVVARWGGEEFVVLSPGIPVAGCAELAERIRAAAAGHMFPAVGRVTVSVGVTEYTHGDTPDSLFARADKALYAAKDGGRDRVETIA
jgi:diguanylate cyclase (GGDEF)-like protein